MTRMRPAVDRPSTAAVPSPPSATGQRSSVADPAGRRMVAHGLMRLYKQLGDADEAALWSQRAAQ